MGHLRATVGHPRVTIGNLRVTIGHLRVTIGHPRVTVGHLRVTVGHPRVTIRGCPYIMSAAITRQGQSECLRTLTQGSKGSFKSLCHMKIHIKGGNQSNTHFV